MENSKDEIEKKSINNRIKIELSKDRDTTESFENANTQLTGYFDHKNKGMKDLNNDLKEFKTDLKSDFKLDYEFDLKQKTDRLDDLNTDLNEIHLFKIEEQLNENFIDEALSFPTGVFIRMDCEICFDETFLYKRSCCNFAACSICLSKYFREKVSLGIFSIQCINNKCKSLVSRNEVSVSLEPKYKEIYHNLLRANNDLNKLMRTCVNCNFLHKLKDNSELKKMRKSRKKDPTASRYAS
jgi:hypothetical protein